MDIEKLSRQIHYHRKMLNVQRLTGTPKLRSYNLAEHGFFVALLFQDFAKIEKVEYGIEVLEIVLKHDFLEVLTADLPYHVKNLNYLTKESWMVIEEEVAKSRSGDFFSPLITDDYIKETLNEEQFRLMKACDILELYLFCKEEQELGNKSRAIEVVIENCIKIEKFYRFESILMYMRGREEE